MNIILKNEEELLSLTGELISILHKLRKSTKEWNEYYGYERLKAKKFYESKADELISRFKIGTLNNNELIKIEVNQ
jgi:hypothetical protein